MLKFFLKISLAVFAVLFLPQIVWEIGLVLWAWVFIRKQWRKGRR